MSESFGLESGERRSPSSGIAINPQLLWAVVVTILGVAFAAGMFKGTSSTSEANAASQYADMKAQLTSIQSSVNSLTTQFNASSAATGERLKGVEDKVQTLTDQQNDLKAQLQQLQQTRR